MEAPINPEVIQEIVSHWTNAADVGTKPKLSENDILSLYEVLNGHFITRTGEAAKEPIIDDTPKIIDCKECGKMFTTVVNLEKHKLVHQNRDKFVCTKCDRRFISDTGLAKHMTKHIEPVNCAQCKQTFTTQAYLDQHMAVHKYGKTY